MPQDRTDEFKLTVKSMAGRPQFLAQSGQLPMELRARKGAAVNGHVNSPLTNPQSPQFNQFSRFMGGSRSIARDLFLTYQKLEKINLLASKKTIFDDEESSRELNELVYIVKQDITSLNKQIEQLRQLQIQQNGGSGSTTNVKSHTKNVVLTLQQQLASISSSFKSTLELRTENMRKQKQRREQFTTAPTISTPFLARQEPPRGLSHSRSSSATASTVIDLGDHQPEPPRRLPPQQMQQQTLLQFEDQSTQYLEDRANTMQSIESTIVELGAIFNQLATMVQQQEEMITRIDANVSDTLLNVEGAHQSLLQYLASVSSNRWLIIKVFGVLFVFFLIFVLFAA